MGRTPVTVVVPTKGRLDLTLTMLRSLKGQEYDDLILFDNGGPWEEQARLKAAVKAANGEYARRPDASIHEMWNEGLDRSKGHTLICNNDIVIGRGAIRSMAQILATLPSVVAISPRHDGKKPTMVVRQVNQIAAVNGLAGFCFMLRAGWDYRFPTELRWWYGDNDMIRTAYTQGRSCAVDDSATVAHVGGGSQTGRWMEDPVKKAEIAADREWFEQKWSTP